MSDYDFSTLSPYDFEALAADLLSKDFGMLLQTFRQGADKGIDLRFAGSGNRAEIVVQCKHYRLSSFPKLLSKIKEEIPKIERIKPKRYVLVTSFDLSVDNIDKIHAALSPYCISKDDIIGKKPLNQLLEQNPEIQKRHFKLWFSSVSILERILNNAVFTQSRMTKETIANRLSTYVSSVADPKREPHMHHFWTTGHWKDNSCSHSLRGSSRQRLGCDSCR